MTEDAPVKSEGAPESSSTDRKTEEGTAPSDPSPPRLAPEAPMKTPKKEEEKGEDKSDAKPTLASPPEEPPTLVRASPQQQQLNPTPPQSNQPQKGTPLPPYQGKPRGRPPGVPNKSTTAQMNQMSQMNLQMKQLAQQTAQFAHRNGHGPHQMIPQQMMGPAVVQVNKDGHQQLVHMIPGQPGQFIQQIYPGTLQGRARCFPVSQLRPPQQPQPQQTGGPKQTVPVLIPVTPGQSNNAIPVPQSAIMQRPDGSFTLTPEFIQKHMSMQGMQHIRVVDPNGGPIRQLQLTNEQHMHMQRMMQQGQMVGMPNVIIQQRPPNDMHHLQQMQQQQQQQLTRQNLDRLATNSAAAAVASSGNRTSDWVGGLPPPASNGAGGPSPLHPMPQLQHLPPQPPPDGTDLEEEEQEAAPQLAAENEPNLNVESLNAEEAFQQESTGGHGRKKNAGKQSKVLIHEIDGHKIIETTEPSNSAHLDVDDFEPMHDDDDDQSDKSYEGREDDGGQRKSLNGVAPVLVTQAAEWMQNRLEMDIPRDERKPKDTPQSHKPATRADGKKTKRGKQKTNELKSLLQMDFGPAENSRRARDMLPVVIKTAEATLKETPKSLPRVSKERRSTSALGGALPAATNGKETRSLRTRDSTDKCKECKTCGVLLEDSQKRPTTGKPPPPPGYCSQQCYRISCSPTNSEDEEDEKTSVRTDETPEPTKRTKESSTTPTSNGKRRIKEEPVEEKETTQSASKRRGRGTGKKEEEMMITPKKEILTPKKESADKRKVKEERMDEEMEEEKQKSPAAKRRSVVEKKEEPASKTRKVETPTVPAAAAAHAAAPTPVLVAALSAPSVYPQQPPPAAAAPPPPSVLVQQLQQQPRLPAAVAEVAPSPAVAAAPVPAAAPTAAAPSTHVMDPTTCRQLSVEQVRAWVEQITGKPEVAQQFADEDVDGETLLTLKYDDLRGDLKLSLGMAKKVYAAIEEIGKRRPMGSDD